ncbi:MULTISPECIES: alkaline phosphatase PhoX [unclassified Frankia]|uniref:alkaline phosphatase PhoX n=1 Tax=unclassified Frankia TaxID=2632575 RepID=UPI0020257C30
MSVSRRQVIAGTGTAGLGFVLSGAVGSIFGGTASAATPNGFHGYGELIPDPAKIADLPKGFQYKVLSRAGVDTVLTGEKLPGLPDGMFAFPGRKRNNAVLVRNHELSPGAANPVPHLPGLVYDPGAAGGTTTVTVEGGQLLSQVASLAGTIRNCAGGHTPWGTWLSCEETELTPASDARLTKKHGYVFEVDPQGRLNDTEAVPLKALGRYAHEAVAVDPKTGVLYLTEDAGSPLGLIYRFLPAKPLGGPGSLRAGGKLQALAVADVPDLSVFTELGTTLPVTWVDVPDPDATTTPVRKQFADNAVTRVSKAEGIFWERTSAYIVSSYAKASSRLAGVHEGQVWEFNPRKSTIELVVRIAPGGRFDGPDNITISPYGSRIVLAEDGDGENYLTVVGDDGTVYPLARNVASDGEWAGVTFSPDGTWLYANAQVDGLTIAITGPWRNN